MNILLSSDSFYPHPGGVSEYMYYLARYLRRAHHRVTVLAPHYNEPYEDDPDTVRIGRCYLFTANKATITVTFHPKLPQLVRKFMRHEDFDIVHTNGPIGWNLPYWALHYSRATNIATFHTAFTGMNLYHYGKLLFKGVYQEKLHGIIYPSRAAKRTTYPHFRLPYTIIANGVDTEKFSPAVEPLEKFPKDRPKILFLGRMDPRKGLDRLLAAFPLIHEHLSRAILIVVGGGPLLKTYQNMVPPSLRNSVFFEGRVPAELIPRYYASCDVYVSPATGGEVFGIVLTEAMATGKPVAASDISGYNEVIAHGNNGLLFNAQDARNIADTLLSILTNEELRASLSRNARMFAESVSWSRITQQVISYYECCMKQRFARSC